MYNEKTNARIFLVLCLGVLVLLISLALMPFFFVVGMVGLLSGLCIALAAWATLVWRKHRFIRYLAPNKEDILFYDTNFFSLYFRLLITKKAIVHYEEICHYLNPRTNELQLRKIELIEPSPNNFVVKGSFVIGFGRAYIYNFNVSVAKNKKTQVLSAIDKIKEIIKNRPPIIQPFVRTKIAKKIAELDSFSNIEMLEKLKQQAEDKGKKENNSKTGDPHSAPPA